MEAMTVSSACSIGRRMVRRTRTLLVTPVLLASTFAVADVPNVWIEVGTRHLQKGKSVTEGLLWVDGPIRGPVGYFVFAYAGSDRYREIYGGPSIKALPWLELGMGLGRENEGNGRRRNAYFSADGEAGSISGYFENGASGPSHKVYLNYWVGRSFGLGMMDDTSGRGPRVVLRLGKNANLWGAILRERSDGSGRAVAAVNYQF